MKLVQFSAAKGPLECCMAVKHAWLRFCQEADVLAVNVTVLEMNEATPSQLPRSILMAVEGKEEAALLAAWQGSILWVCESPFRSQHKRKNWFIGVDVLEMPKELPQGDQVVFKTCRSSGAGGQHVNTTDSAVQATHVATGLTVRVESERSQHANKKMALILLQQKREALITQQQSDKKGILHSHHQNVARGDAKRVFQGPKFIEKM